MSTICTPEQLPVVKASFCLPDINFGEVDALYLGHAGQPFTDWSDLTEWTARLDNEAAADLTKIRYLNVIGNKPAAEKATVDFSKGRKASTTPKHTLPFRIDETGDDNYNLLLWTENNPAQTVQMWYQAGKYLYGGNTGVAASIVLNEVIPESDEELVTIVGTATFEGNHPARIINPMA